MSRREDSDVQGCSNHRGIHLRRHTLKIWGRVAEARLRGEVMVSKQQYGFMQRQSQCLL